MAWDAFGKIGVGSDVLGWVELGCEGEVGICSDGLD